jgi:hypothetical protein
LLSHAKLLSDHPSAGPDVETSGAGDAFDDLHSKGENVFRPDEQPSGVTAVGPDQPDGGEAAAQCGQESVCGVVVLDRGGGGDDGEQQAVHIHGDVPLDAVISSWECGVRDVHDGCWKSRIERRGWDDLLLSITELQEVRCGCMPETEFEYWTVLGDD